MKVAQWRMAELSLTAQGDYRAPFQELEVRADFVGPRGEKLTRPAFWDGGKTWRVRFAPTSVGIWRFSTIASNTKDVGVHGQHGTVECIPYRGILPIYKHGFLRCEKRHHAHRDGTPFLWLADTHWLWESEPWDAFVAMAQKRLEQGFSVYQVEFFTRWRGDEPDIAHFQKNMDPKWAYLAERGIVVAATHGLLERPTTEKIATREVIMARYLCARYGAYPAAWLMFQECTGHYAEWFHSPAEREAFMTAVRKVGRAYKAADGYHHPRTAHSDAPLKTAYRGEDWLDFTLFQGGHDVKIDRDPYYDCYFDEKTTLPQIEGEANYEQLFDGADKGSPKAISVDLMREKAYQAMQCGCAGYTYGANGVWQAVLGPNDSDLHRVYGRTLWSTGIKLPGGEQLRHWRNFYAALPWHRLQPRPKCDGFATWEAPLSPSERPALATDPERNTVVVYFYRGQPFSGTIQKLQGASYRARWFDPRRGVYLPLPHAQGPSWHCPPKPDSDDWLLVLTAIKPMRKVAPVPFGWATLRRESLAEQKRNVARNLAHKATVTASSTDLVNKVYAPQHAVNGDANTTSWHHWSSDGTQLLPAWLQLTWPQPVTFTELHLSFMHDYEVSDYAIEVEGKVILEVKNNTETVRKHVFPKPLTVQQLRFVGRRGPANQPSIIRIVEWEVLA